MMKIVSHVCAQFKGPDGRVIRTVRPEERNDTVEVPEAIRQDPLFALLLQDGSLEIVETQAQQKRLENDPEAGIGPDGKALRAEAKPAEEKAADALASDAATAVAPDKRVRKATEKKAGE